LEYEADFIVLGAGSLGVSISYLLGALSNSRVILVERESGSSNYIFLY